MSYDFEFTTSLFADRGPYRGSFTTVGGSDDRFRLHGVRAAPDGSTEDPTELTVVSTENGVRCLHHGKRKYWYADRWSFGGVYLVATVRQASVFLEPFISGDGPDDLFEAEKLVLDGTKMMDGKICRRLALAAPGRVNLYLGDCTRRCVSTANDPVL